jgi:beta-glucanase (GH16 family)
MQKRLVALAACIAVVLGLGGCTAGGDGHSASRTPSGAAMPIPTKTAAVLAAARAAAPSGVMMPTGNVPGWTREFAEDFATDVPVGHFPGTVYGAKWGAYRDGWKDTSGRGTYLPSKVLSTRGGLLDYSIRTENGVHMVSAPTPKLPRGAYGRYSVRFRADALPGYKTAWLLWPDSGRSPPDGEIDFPEGALDGQIGAFLHHADRSGQQEAFSSPARYTTWHTATTEWVQGTVTFILDGQVIGRSTTRVPDKPMHWVLQTETATDGTGVSDATSGHVQIDWVVAYKAAAIAAEPGAGALEVAAVGDIQPPSLSENSAGTAAEAAKADLILGLGDYQYETGRLSDYNAFFDQDWGRNVAKTYPVLATTHDQGWSGDPLRYWNGEGAHGYRGPVRLKPHQSYSFDRAGWHFLAIDDSCYADQGRCSPDELVSWVRADLGAHPSRCTVAYWHEAYFTSTAGHPAYEEMKPVVQALQAGGVDIVLQGRNHDYERFAPQTADRVVDPKGLQAFVVGTGGIGFYTFKDTAANSVTRTDSTYGVLRLTLGNGRYRWRFVRTGGTAFTDSGERTCH